MTRIGIADDYDYNETHKRTRLTLWSGSFLSDYEGEAYSLPKNDGYMVTLDHMLWSEKIRVTCPCPRDDDNHQEVDRLINEAIQAHKEQSA